MFVIMIILYNIKQKIMYGVSIIVNCHVTIKKSLKSQIPSLKSQLPQHSNYCYFCILPPNFCSHADTVLHNFKHVHVVSIPPYFLFLMLESLLCNFISCIIFQVFLDQKFNRYGSRIILGLLKKNLGMLQTIALGFKNQWMR